MNVQRFPSSVPVQSVTRDESQFLQIPAHNWTGGYPATNGETMEAGRLSYWK